MKRFVKLYGVLGILLAFGLVSCSDGSGGGGGGGGGVSTAGLQSLLKFKMANMDALAINESAGANAQLYSSRSASRSAESDAMLVKILEDGSIESFIEVPDYITLSRIKYIAQSPAENSDAIYVVFEGSSHGGYNDGSSRNWISVTIGQLLCILPDGTYYDILQPETDNDGMQKSYKYLSFYDNIDPIAFDNNGYMYYLVHEGSGSSNTNVIYKFDPATGESVQLTPKIDNTYYRKFQVSKDGEWIFAQANRWFNGGSETRYLRAIPTSNPSANINLYYDSTNTTWVNDWFYDEDAECVYAVFSESFVRFPKKDGTFSQNDKEVIFTSGSTGNMYFYSDALFGNWVNKEITVFKGYAQAYDLYDTTVDENDYINYLFRDPEENEEGGHDLKPEVLAKYLFAKAYDSLLDDERAAYKAGVTADEPTYRITFEAFADIQGYELLATVTDGLYNEDALSAIEEAKLETLLKSLWEEPRGRYAQDTMFGYTKANFFADIIQEKVEGVWEPISSDKFRKNFANDAFYESCGVDSWTLFTTNWTNTRDWRKDLLDDDGKLDAELFLAKLASYCSVSEIDFSLEVFAEIAQTQPKYIGLYTTKKNEEAVAFLDDDVKRELLNNYICSLVCDQYNAYGEFLLQTCFKKDTTESAYIWREDSGSDYFWWGSVREIVASQGLSVYGICSNNGDSRGVIKIIDEDGNSDGTTVAALSQYKLTDSVAAEDGFFFKSAILNGSDESGYHQLLYYDVEDESCTNLFENLTENKETSELISYTIGGDYAYCCTAANGFNIVSFKINITTGEVTSLGSNQKLSQIIVIK